MHGRGANRDKTISFENLGGRREAVFFILGIYPRFLKKSRVFQSSRESNTLEKKSRVFEKTLCFEIFENPGFNFPRPNRGKAFFEGIFKSKRKTLMESDFMFQWIFSIT